MKDQIGEIVADARGCAAVCIAVNNLAAAAAFTGIADKLEAMGGGDCLSPEVVRAGLISFYQSQSHHHVGSNNTLSAAAMHVNEAMQFVFQAAENKSLIPAQPKQGESNE